MASAQGSARFDDYVYIPLCGPLHLALPCLFCLPMQKAGTEPSMQIIPPPESKEFGFNYASCICPAQVERKTPSRSCKLEAFGCILANRLPPANSQVTKVTAVPATACSKLHATLNACAPPKPEFWELVVALRLKLSSKP